MELTEKNDATRGEGNHEGIPYEIGAYLENDDKSNMRCGPHIRHLTAHLKLRAVKYLVMVSPENDPIRPYQIQNDPIQNTTAYLTAYLLFYSIFAHAGTP